MAKKKNNFGTYLLGFLLATLVIGVASKIELPTSNNNSKTSNSNSSNVISSSIDPSKIFGTLNTNDIRVANLTNANTASSSFVYRNLTLFENSNIIKIGLPIKTITDYTLDSIFSVHLINQDLTTEEYIDTYELKIEANTYTSNTINEWVYFDVDINIDDGQTLALGSKTDTIVIGCSTSSLLDEDLCSVTNKVANGVSGDEKEISSKIYVDFIKSI